VNLRIMFVNKNKLPGLDFQSGMTDLKIRTHVSRQGT